MPCYHPLEMWYCGINHETKKGIYEPTPKNCLRNGHGEPVKVIKVPCGQCIGCRLDRSRDWAIRCMCEADCHDENCFITLTYNPENLPKDMSLHLEHVTKFWKRLRKKYGQVRYLQCGEYGELGLRPHYHACVFGLDFSADRFYPVCVRRATMVSQRLWTCSALQDLWPYGFVSIGAVTFDSACYVARYCLKKVTGDKAEEHYQGRAPEFCTMSRRPGIGKEYYDLHKKEIYAYDQIVYGVGKVAKPSRYFDGLYDLESPVELVRIKDERKKIAMQSSDYVDSPIVTTAEAIRLAEKERVKETTIESLRKKI